MSDLEQNLRAIVREEVIAVLRPGEAVPIVTSQSSEEFDAAVRRGIAAGIEDLRERVDVVLLKEAAAIIGISAEKLYQMRLNGIGPSSRKWGRRIGFRREDLESWMEYRRRGILKKVPQDMDLDDL